MMNSVLQNQVFIAGLKNTGCYISVTIMICNFINNESTAFTKTLVSQGKRPQQPVDN